MYLKSIVTGVCCCALAYLPLLAQTAPATSDKDFMNMAAQTDMLEAHLGQMAQDQGLRQDVKDYGQMLVTDHTANYKDVSALAAKNGGDVPKGIDAQGNKMIDALAKLKGAAFDRRFVTEMIQGHTRAIAEFQRESKNGQNADVKAFADSTLPKLREHLEKARDLAKPANSKHAK